MEMGDLTVGVDGRRGDQQRFQRLPGTNSTASKNGNVIQKRCYETVSRRKLVLNKPSADQKHIFFLAKVINELYKGRAIRFQRNNKSFLFLSLDGSYFFELEPIRGRLSGTDEISFSPLINAISRRLGGADEISFFSSIHAI